MRGIVWKTVMPKISPSRTMCNISKHVRMLCQLWPLVGKIMEGISWRAKTQMEAFIKCARNGK